MPTRTLAGAALAARDAAPDLRAWFDHEVEPFLAGQAAAVEHLGKWGLYPIAGLLGTFLGGVAFGCAEWLWPALGCFALLIPAIAVNKVRGPIYQAGGAAFRAVFKQRVVREIVARVLPGASYDPDLAVGREVVAASGLVSVGISYRGDDLVRGAIGRTAFALGDIRTFGGRKSNSRAVQGILFHAEFNRSLAGRTVIVPHGEAPPDLPVNRDLAPATLENPDFRARFSVFASDPVEARYVLTPSAMEHLVALARLFDRKLYAAFDRRRVYLLVDNGRGAFEALAFGGEKAWDETRNFAALFDGARAIVEELELNTRIWTKGFAPAAEAQAASACEPSAWTRVAKLGAWAFYDNHTPTYTLDDRPAPPSRVAITRGPSGLCAAYGGTWGTWFSLALALAVAGFTQVPAAAALAREWRYGLLLFAASVASTAIYLMSARVRRIEAGASGLRVRGLWSTRSFAPGEVVHVFAAEDLALARVQGSWRPVPLSPRLGGHGAALWLAGEVQHSLGGGRR